MKAPSVRIERSQGGVVRLVRKPDVYPLQLGEFHLADVALKHCCTKSPLAERKEGGSWSIMGAIFQVN